MKVKILNEAGYAQAMLGLSLSYNQPIENMPAVACKLIPKGGSHIKFLESIAVWLDITAARYWWQQFDTYRVGVTKQSGSTMHTLMKRELDFDDFETMTAHVLTAINWHIRNSDPLLVKAILPEGFLQRRIVCTNYGTLRRVLIQRHHHKLHEWTTFRQAILAQVEHPEFFGRERMLREKLAALIHDMWSGWIDHVASKSTFNFDGSMTIPAGFVVRRERQMRGSYDDLSEEEKDSDRREADKVLALLKEHFAASGRMEEGK